MTVVFADSSALVKLYVDEPGSTTVRRAERRSRFVVSALARVEVPSALWRKARARSLDGTDARLLTASFEGDWYGSPDEPPRFPVVTTSWALLAEAARLCETHDLRASDAIQLASALSTMGGERIEFACFDRRLSAAAEAEGLPVLAPG